MINIHYKLTVLNFAKLDEIIKKQVQNLLGSSLMNFAKERHTYNTCT